jgi:hypothetical protein
MRAAHIYKHKKFWQIAGLFAVDGLFFGLTNPDQVPSVLLIVGFLLLIVTIYSLTHMLLSLGKFYGIDIHRKTPGLTGLITAVSGIMLALDSTGQLTSRDMAVMIPLTVIAYGYLRSVRTRKIS